MLRTFHLQVAKGSRQSAEFRSSINYATFLLSGGKPNWAGFADAPGLQTPRPGKRRQRSPHRQTPRTCDDLSVCFGERLPALLREFMLPCDGVERRLSLGGGGLAGSTGTEPGSPTAGFFLLEGGMREEGSTGGTGSFSRARYTRCMALGGRQGLSWIQAKVGHAVRMPLKHQEGRNSPLQTHLCPSVRLCLCR